MSVPESRQSTAREPDSLNTNSVNGARRVRRNDLEELPDPTGGIYTSGALPLAKTETVDTAERQETYLGLNSKNNGGGSLLQGEYNEAQSHQAFLEALNAWRTGGTTKPKGATKPSTVGTAVHHL